MKVYLNGKFISQEEAKASILDPGFLYGQGLFETMRSYNGKIFRLDAHIERLLKSLPVINITLDAGSGVLKEAIKRCLRENNLKDAYVRLTVWQAEGRVSAAVVTKSYSFMKREDYQNGFKAIISKRFRQNEFSPLSQVKSSNYLQLLLAYQEAKKQNADEALLLNTQGFLSEASRANIFMVKDNCLITPSLSCGCLCGITRDTVLGIAQKEKIEVIETKITPHEFYKAGEAFLTNSLIELMPLTEIERNPIHKGIPGKITELLLKRYKELIRK